MRAQAIVTEASKYFDTGNLNQTTQKTSSQSSSFNDVMNKSLSTDQTAKKEPEGTKITKQDNSLNADKKPEIVQKDADGKESAVKTDKSENKEDSSQNDKNQVNTMDEKTQDISESKDKTKSVKSLKNPNDILDGIMKNLSSINDAIKSVIKDTLKISDEDLEKIMSELGMQFTDLLNNDNLKKFVLAANGKDDISAFLTNEDMTKQFTQLMKGLDNIDFQSELGISKEDLSTILESLQQQVQTQQVQPVLQKESVVENAKSEQVNSVKNESLSETEPDISVTVEKVKSGETLQQESLKNSDSNKQESQQEAPTASPLDSFVQNLVGTAQQNVEELTPQLDKLSQMKEIIKQIVDKIKVVIKPEATSMEIQLNPENLGKVSLSVISKNGQLTAHFTAESQAAKEAIESQLQTLKDTLSNQGLKVDAVEVNVSNFAFSQSNQPESGTKDQKGTAKRQNHVRELNVTEDTLDDVETTSDTLQQNGGSIDYTA